MRLLDGCRRGRAPSSPCALARPSRSAGRQASPRPSLHHVVADSSSSLLRRRFEIRACFSRASAIAPLRDSAVRGPRDRANDKHVMRSSASNGPPVARTSKHSLLRRDSPVGSNDNHVDCALRQADHGAGSRDGRCIEPRAEPLRLCAHLGPDRYRVSPMRRPSSSLPATPKIGCTAKTHRR